MERKTQHVPAREQSEAEGYPSHFAPQQTVHPETLRGRGARSNRVGRFEREARERFDDGWGSLAEGEVRATEVMPDPSRRVLTRNASPDVPFDLSLNPYKGCEHGCIYCFARPTHAYLGLSPGLDFETRIFAKHDAAELLARELAKPSYRCKTLCIGANTDPYQPVEKNLGITRRVLETCEAFGQPCGLITKSHLVTRDLDILARMAERRLVSVAISVTTLDRRLARLMEPRAASPVRRLDAIRQLSAAGVPVTLLMAPMIPALNDHEIEKVLGLCARAGAKAAGYVLLRLPGEIRDLWLEWLEAHYPDRAKRVMNLLREMRGGRDYQAQWGLRMRGSGTYAQLLSDRFALARKRYGLQGRGYDLDCGQFAVPDDYRRRAGVERAQLDLFS